MATCTESDRYALPSLQYTRGDVLIKLGHEASDWLVVHSASLSEASPKLKATLSARWEATIGINRIQHPRTGESVNVKILALKFVEGTYFLEGKEVVEDRRWEAEVFQDSQWCSGWPYRGRGGQLVLNVTKRAFRVLFATMHGVDLTAEQVAGCSDVSEGRLENINASSWINWILLPQIVTVCAIAEYLGCLTAVGPTMMAILQSAPRYWQAVAYRPLDHLMLAMKLKNREVYYDALQHAMAQAFHDIDGLTWQDISAVTGVRADVQQAAYGRQFRLMLLSAENLKEDLLRLQTARGQSQRARRPQKKWSFFGMTIAGPGYDAEEDVKEHYALIAREIFGQWLAQHLYVQETTLSPLRHRSEDLNVRRLVQHDAPALRLNLAVHRLEQAAHSPDSTSIFGLSTPRRFASQLSIFGRGKAETGIKQALIDLVKATAIPIERFRNLDLTRATVEQAEDEYMSGRRIWGLMKHRIHPMPHTLHITGGPHFDGYDSGYFTCLKISATVPFDDAVEGSAVHKCEPLDSETLLASQRWMDRVFEPLDETRRPFVLDRNTLTSIVYILKFAGVIAISLYVGLVLLSL